MLYAIYAINLHFPFSILIYHLFILFIFKKIDLKIIVNIISSYNSKRKANQTQSKLKAN